MSNQISSDLDDLSGLNSESELPHLSDAISYETDIAPYRYIQIYAGVGSGKNTFINRFVNGDPEKKIPKMIVLVPSFQGGRAPYRRRSRVCLLRWQVGKHDLRSL